MPANIMQNWSHLAPQKDFFESFVAPLIMGQEMAKKQAEQEQLQIQNQYMPQNYEAEILGRQLQNQEREATLPYAGKNAEAELMGQLLLNENRGLENQYIPQNQQIKQQEHALAQALRNMQMQKYEAEINQINNPAEFNPLGQPGAGGQVALANWYESRGDAESAELVRSAIGGNSGLRQWSGLPQVERQDILAKGRAWGVDSTEMQDRVISGETLQQIASAQAEKEGVSYDAMIDRDPIYLTTEAAKTAFQKREAFTSEAQYLTDTFVDWMRPYVTPTALATGISPSALWDRVSGENKEDQMKFVAATIIYPDLVSARARGLGMTLGVEALRDMAHAGLGGIKPVDAMPADIWSGAQKLAQEAITGGSEYARSIAVNPEKHAREKENKSQENNYNSMSEEDADARIAELKAELGE